MQGEFRYSTPQMSVIMDLRIKKRWNSPFIAGKEAGTNVVRHIALQNRWETESLLFIWIMMISVYDLTLQSNINHRVFYKKESE